MPQIQTAAIKTLDLHRSFGAKHVLCGINLEIAPGELVALAGKNGSGKTTLLRILSTLIMPTRGHAWVCGFSTDSDTEKKAVRGQIGWVSSSDGGFVPRLTGRENIWLFGGLRKLSKKNIDGFLWQWKDFSVLTEALNTPYLLCSAGMKQSLSIVRAALYDPTCLFMDEPLKALDQESKIFLAAFLNNHWRQKTIFYSNHQEAAVDFKPDRILNLQGGQII